MSLLNNNPFENTNTRAKKLKVSKAKNQESKVQTKATATQAFKMKNTSGKNKGGVQISNSKSGSSQTIMLKTNYVQSGYNYKTGKTSTNAEVGAHNAAALSYINREGANQDIAETDMSNIYDKFGDRLTEDQYKELTDNLKDNGAEAFRRFEFSPGFDLDRDEMAEIVSEAAMEFIQATDKQVDIHFAIHTNTDNVHAHVNMEGSKDDIKMSKEQLQMFKIKLAEKTAEKLNDRNIEHTLDKTVERDIKYYEDMKKLDEIKSDFQPLKESIKETFKEDLSKEFSKQTQDIKFSEKELEQINTLQKAKGAQDNALRKDDMTKYQKMQDWEKSIESKMSSDTLNKLEKFDKAVNDFKESHGAQSIKEDRDQKLLDVAKAEAGQIKEHTSFKKAADNTISKQREENKKDLKFSKDQAIEAKGNEIKKDQVIDQTIQSTGGREL